MAQGEEFDGPEMFDTGVSYEALDQSVHDAAAAGVAAAMQGVIDPVSIISDDVRTIVSMMQNGGGTFKMTDSGVTGGAISVGLGVEEVATPIVDAIERLSKEIQESSQRQTAATSRQRNEDRQDRERDRNDRVQREQDQIQAEAELRALISGIDAKRVAEEQAKVEREDKVRKALQKMQANEERLVELQEANNYLLESGKFAEAAINQMTSDQVLAEARKAGYVSSKEIVPYSDDVSGQQALATTVEGLRDIITSSRGGGGGRGGSTGASSRAVGGLQRTVGNVLGTVNEKTGEVEGGTLSNVADTLTNVGEVVGNFASKGGTGAGAAGKVASTLGSLGGKVGAIAGTAAKFLPVVGTALMAAEIASTGIDEYRQFQRTANEQGIDFGQYVAGRVSENTGWDSFITGIDEGEFQKVQQGLISGGIKTGSAEHKEGYDFARGAMADYGVSAQNAAQYYTNMIKAGRTMDDLTESMDALKQATQGTALTMTDAQAMVAGMGKDFSRVLGGNEALSETAAFDIMKAVEGDEGTAGEFFTQLVSDTDFTNPAMDKEVRELIDKGVPIGLAYAQVAQEHPEYSKNDFIRRPLSKEGKSVLQYIQDKDATGLAQAFRDSGNIGITVQDILQFATDYGVPEKVVKELDWDSLAEYLCGDVAETGENIEEGEVRANVESSNQQEATKEADQEQAQGLLDQFSNPFAGVGAASQTSTGTTSTSTTSGSTGTASAGVTAAGTGTTVKGLVDAGILTKEQASALGAGGSAKVVDELAYRYGLADTSSSMVDWLKTDEGKQAYEEASTAAGGTSDGQEVRVTIGFADNAQSALYAMVMDEEDRLSRDSGVE